MRTRFTYRIDERKAHDPADMEETISPSQTPDNGTPEKGNMDPETVEILEDDQVQTGG